MKKYLVGGAVRDSLLGIKVMERDWVVIGETPDSMRSRGYAQVGKDFPVFLHPKTKEEYALARTERKSGKGYHGFEMDTSSCVTLEEDLSRRDLTINAIAKDSHAHLIDPYNGQIDIKNRVLRHVSPAFAEDPVRILRIARFAAQFASMGFTVASETKSLMSNMVNTGEIDTLVPERVWQETLKALNTKHPRHFFEELNCCGALKTLFPELARLFGVPQKIEYHPEIDTGLHTMMVLDQACKISSDPRVRFAAICHDLGKGVTPKNTLPRHHGHEERSADLTHHLCKRNKVPNDFRDLAVLVARYHTHCHRAFELKPATILKTLNHLDAMRRPDRFEAFLLACKADAHGRLGFENIPYPQADFFRGAQNKLNEIDSGKWVAMGGSGEAIGQRLHQHSVKVLADWKQQQEQTISVNK